MLWHFNTKLCARLLAEVWLCQEKLNVAVTGLTKGWKEEKERAASPVPLSISTCWVCGAGPGHVLIKKLCWLLLLHPHFRVRLHLLEF